MQFSKQTIAAISEVTFRQCENFANDLEMFARHGKRSTINTEDVKLLARRSHSLFKAIASALGSSLATNCSEKKNHCEPDPLLLSRFSLGEQTLHRPSSRNTSTYMGLCAKCIQPLH
ncbi:APITD1 [Cervus elaphus hippelaphus]|uniref:Centromere protein S n=1 Tax=Cervus elaphus hippelaphus TaxID=46360 RepID=A0A212CS88_CEREH|nr:APITD1 [Cervus elaphus hippelaphus]